MAISLLFLLIVLTFGSIHAAEHPIESTTSSAGSNEKLSAGSQPSASPATQTASSSAEFFSSSSSQPPAVSPSAQPHPPGSEPAPSEQKVSGQSVEKEKAEENGVGGPPKDSGTSGKLGGSSSAESSGHSVADQSSPSSPTANGVNGQYSGWIGSSLLTMIAIGALIA